MAFHPHRFGRYIIVDPIAVGGMAEIYRARLAAAKEGPDRIIVIKKVIANLSQNSEFISMFEEEIKITVGLTHPNIIQIYDYGKVDDQYFMAMEYVEGKNLRQFVKRLADMKSMFSIDMSCYIISQVCHALAHAHGYKDRMTGKPLGIVHRDISPQNIMISYDGAVKLFDFGIAKAKSASEATRAGVIKGKPSYLSPEQINGEELDGRCDIFALGIVLWELLTAKRLFVADTDMGVLRLIQSAKIEPPSTFNPAVPQALDSIVLKSLTRDKAKRYQSAEEFQRDLHKFLYSFNPSFNPADLSYYAQELFKSEIRDDRERLSKYLGMEPVDDGGPAAEAEKAGKKPQLSNKLAEGLISTTDFNREMMDKVAQNTGSINKPSALELMSSSAMPQPKTAQVGTATGTGKPPIPGSGTRSTVLPPGARRPGSQDNMVIPPWSKPSAGSSSLPRAGTRTQSRLLRKELEQDSSSGGRNALVLLAVLAVGLVFAARQFGMLEGTILEALAPAKQDAAAPVKREIASEPEAPQPNQLVVQENEGVIFFRTKVAGYRVLVNGVAKEVQNHQVAVPLNTPLKIEVQKSGFMSVQFDTTLTTRGMTVLNLSMSPMPSGTLIFTTTPDSNISIYVGDRQFAVGRTPYRNDHMPVGRYKVVAENSILGSRTEIEVVIEEGKVTRVERVLGK